MDEDVRPPALDELAALWRSLPPFGPWLEDAACGSLGSGSDVFTLDHPDPAELALAERVCRRCPVRSDCAAYAAQVPVWGLWGGPEGSARAGGVGGSQPSAS